MTAKSPANTFSALHWTTLVALGGILNVLVNYGYKVLTTQTDVAWIATGALTVTAFVMFLHGKRTGTPRELTHALVRGRTPLVIIAVGGAVTVSFICFLSALASGPISLVDPLWACVYSLVSIALGMLIIRERPSGLSLLGIAFYLLGAALMAQG